MAKPSPVSPTPPRWLVLELWGLGDLALAIPFLRAASAHARVTLLAKPHAGPLLARFAPQIEHLPLTAPWTAFTGKYRLYQWPWRTLMRTMRTLRAEPFDVAVSVRRDPRDHLVMALAGVRHTHGYPYPRLRGWLTHPSPTPVSPHRAAAWRGLAAALGMSLPLPTPPPRVGRNVVIHVGAGRPVRAWPRERFAEIAERLRHAGWNVTVLSGHETNLDDLVSTLAAADRFIGNDSGPGHLAALLGVPTFTIFGQLPEVFAPQHPQAVWMEGAPCPYKPCFDHCRYPAPHCILSHDVDTVWRRIKAWIE